MKKRLICVVLVSCLLTGLFAGCGKEKKVDANGNPITVIRLAHDNNVIWKLASEISRTVNDPLIRLMICLI